MARYTIKVDLSDITAFCGYVQIATETWPEARRRALADEVLSLADERRGVDVEMTPQGCAALATPDLLAVLRRHGLSGPAIPVRG